MARLILLFCAVISTINAQCTVEKAEPQLRRAVYEFSIDLLQRTAQDTDYHFVSSPLSVWTLLASASLGAADETLSEMKKVLHLSRNKCFNNKYLEIANLVTSVDETDGSFLERSAVIFADDQARITDIYKNKVARSKISKIEEISFENLDQSAATINDYVRTATHDTIEDIVSPGDLENVVLVMIDALFFKGTWTKPFSEEDTEESAFYNDLNVQVGDVQLMYSMDEYNVTVLDQLQAQVLELPYGQNRRFSMFVFLPLMEASLATVIDSLQHVSLPAIRNLFATYGPTQTIVQLPRFKVSSDLSNLKELLSDMGLRAPFDSTVASFPIISDSEIYISTLIQKAEIEVNEQGTTASAASAAEFVSRTRPTQFNANRPFLFMIVDNNNDIPIFTGAFSKPSLF
ncbi:serpin B6-like [Aricia agestis]|uniref:serpin B6-like n=1 Tax=Aricia agestis TaxID=91739 RepID=UPI001C201BD4|nr:serpin B6-like [Aricia agestis]